VEDGLVSCRAVAATCLTMSARVDAANEAGD